MKNSAFSSSFFNIEFDPDELSYTVGDDYMYFRKNSNTNTLLIYNTLFCVLTLPNFIINLYKSGNLVKVSDSDYDVKNN